MNKSKLTEQARLERNKYYREYRAAHPEKTREVNRKYWEKRAAKTNEQGGSDNAEESSVQ